MACNTVCVKCGRKFNRYSGFLLNLSDEFLPEFYRLPSIVEAMKEHKHTTLCAECLQSELGRPLTWNDIKFKNNRIMTSTVSFLLLRKYKDLSLCQDKIELLMSEDNKGLTPYKKSEAAQCLKHYGIL